MNLSDHENSENVQYCFEFVNTSCPRVTRSIAINVALYIFITISILITLFGNLVVIISVLHFKQLQTPTNFLLLSLAVVDFLVGFIVLPYSMVRSVETCWYFGEVFCKIHSIIEIVLTVVSIYTLCFIAIDRYYAMCDPLFYTVKITLPLTVMTIVLIWLFAVFYGFSVFLLDFSKKSVDDYVAVRSCEGSCIAYHKFEGHIDALIVFFIPIFIILGIYVKIFFVARCKHCRKVANMPNESHHTEENNVTLMHKKDQIVVRKQDILIGIFTFSWLPFYVNSILNPYFDFLIPSVLDSVFAWFGFFNSTLNPLLYAFLYPWFRKSLKLILSCQIFNCDPSTVNILSK
ncbi:trace amine-associated receptor 4-like [Chiloscyllium punctatum]|uniref:trace amine-associated receptor 4-like n=1 Tax=Chiloscyllium punctatum TaxID=137246 RepID=UPI003B6428F7